MTGTYMVTQLFSSLTSEYAFSALKEACGMVLRNMLLKFHCRVQFGITVATFQMSMSLLHMNIKVSIGF